MAVNFRDWSILWLWTIGGMSPMLILVMVEGMREGGYTMAISIMLAALGFIMAVRATLPALDGFEELQDLKMFGLGPWPKRKR